MAIGQSARVVIDFPDPETKQAFHQWLKSEGLTLKEWVLDHVRRDMQKTMKGLGESVGGDTGPRSRESPESKTHESNS